MHGHNELLRAARLALPSRARPRGSLRQSELAELVNVEVWRATGRITAMCGVSVGQLERGLRRWPKPWTRAALRTVLGVDTDEQLGFHPPAWELPVQRVERRSPAGAPAVTATTVTVRADGLSVTVRVVGIPGRIVDSAALGGRRRLTVVGG